MRALTRWHPDNHSTPIECAVKRLSLMSADKRLYRLLKKEIEAAGCLRSARFASGLHMMIVLVLYFSGYIALLQEPGSGQRLVLLVVLGITCVQSSFIGHEVGHYGVTRHRGATKFLGYLFMSFVTGYAQTHYMHNHRRHHAHPNDTRRDPDIQGAGILSFYQQSADMKSGPARWVTNRQAYLIWFLLMFQAFSLKMRGLKLIFHRIDSYPSEKLVLGMHFCLWFGAPTMMLGLREALLNYIVITLIVGLYLGAVVLVNHVGLPLRQPGDSVPFFYQTLTTTRDLGVGRLNDIVFGGTNNHVEHHLFPTVPIHKLGAARKITRNFCSLHNILYHEMNWTQAIREVFVHLRSISKQAKVNPSLVN